MLGKKFGATGFWEKLNVFNGQFPLKTNFPWKSK